jgi:hypothetical protein
VADTMRELLYMMPKSKVSVFFENQLQVNYRLSRGVLSASLFLFLFFWFCGVFLTLNFMVTLVVFTTTYNCRQVRKDEQNSRR